MKKIKLAAVAAILLGGWITGGQAEAAAEPVVALPKWSCHRNEHAVVLLRERTHSAGSTFLIRSASGNAGTDCAPRRYAGDVTLGMPAQPDDDEALNFIGLVGPVLMLDAGTGPDRTLVIYEVPQGRKLLETGYSVQGSCDPTSGCRSGEFEIKPSALTFWRRIGTEPTTANCRNFARFMQETGSAAIEQRSMFDFRTHKVSSAGPIRCTIRQ